MTLGHGRDSLLLNGAIFVGHSKGYQSILFLWRMGNYGEGDQRRNGTRSDVGDCKI